MMASDPKAQINRTQVEARQGSTRPKLVYVLGAGVVLVLIAFVVVWLTTTH